MEVEHLALNVAEPVAMARWYVQNLQMTIARGMDEPPYTHFLVDSAGHVALEIYYNPADAVPDYASMHPLRLHLAFTSGDPAADAKRLQAAGAKWVEDVRPEEGSYLVMLRDPWGLALQLCRRAQPFV